VEVGAAADLCVLDRPLAVMLAAPSAEAVRATIVAGRVVAQT
jgi:predicted amidohydrolase YtcJ